MSSIDVFFGTAFRGRFHDGCKDVALHLRDTRRVLSIAVLGLSVLF